jgi:hypothetical protein
MKYNCKEGCKPGKPGHAVSNVRVDGCSECCTIGKTMKPQSDKGTTPSPLAYTVLVVPWVRSMSMQAIMLSGIMKARGVDFTAVSSMVRMRMKCSLKQKHDEKPKQDPAHCCVNSLIEFEICMRDHMQHSYSK